MLKHTAVTLLILATLIGVTEFGLRTAGLRPAGLRPYAIDFAAPDAVTGFKAYGNAAWYFDVTPHGGPVVRKRASTNALGYRPTVENADCADCPLIVVLGDSLTFGAESSDTETWPEYLSQALHASGKNVKVINMSFRGWSTLQQAAALKHADLAGEQVDYVVYFPIPNDAIENIKTAYDLPAPIAFKNGGTLEIKPATPSAPLSRMAFRWKLEHFVRKFALTSLVWKLAGKPLPGIDDPLPAIATDDAGYRSFWPKKLDNAKRYMELLYGRGDEALLAQQAYALGIRQMAEASEKLGAKLVVAPAPFGQFAAGKNAEEFARLIDMTNAEYAAFMVERNKYHQAVKAIAMANGATVLNIDLDAFAGLSYRDYAAVPNDWHYSSAANALLGQEVAKRLLAQGGGPERQGGRRRDEALGPHMSTRWLDTLARLVAPVARRAKWLGRLLSAGLRVIWINSTSEKR